MGNSLQRLDFRAMGSGFALLVASNDRWLSRIRLNAAWAFVQLAERTLSRFDSKSELSKLNLRQGEWVTVSPMLLKVILEALSLAEQSDGLYDPSVLPALEFFGYNRDFQTLSDEGPADKYERASLGSWRRIAVNEESKAIKLPRGTKIDLGGVAKGWTAERTADILASLGPCLVDAGGDIAIRSRPSAEAGWLVGVADPVDPENDLATIALEHCGVATSGVDFRHWRQDGIRRHHIIDPRTGAPATTDLLTATVVAPDAVQAGLFSLMAVILGSRQGLRFLESQPEVEGAVVMTAGGTLSTSGFADYVSQPQPIAKAEQD